MDKLIQSAGLSAALNLGAALAYVLLGDQEWAWSLLRLFVGPGDVASRLLLGAGHDLISVGIAFLLNFLVYWVGFYMLLFLRMRCRAVPSRRV